MGDNAKVKKISLLLRCPFALLVHNKKRGIYPFIESRIKIK